MVRLSEPYKNTIILEDLKGLSSNPFCTSCPYGTLGVFINTAWDCLKGHFFGRKQFGPSPP